MSDRTIATERVSKPQQIEKGDITEVPSRMRAIYPDRIRFKVDFLELEYEVTVSPEKFRKLFPKVVQ